jgi:type IV pilus assembly protein PilE
LIRFILKKSAFTLIELLIVIIIVGVLAATAMPRLFRMVERSRATEAFHTIDIIHSGMEGCYNQYATYVVCGVSFDSLGISDPSLATGSHFTYVISDQSFRDYMVTATRNALDNGDTTSVITMHFGDPGVTRSGSSVFQGIQ